MSWRFRKVFKVLPGVKLNLTRNGLSATFGAAPFSINTGPKGVYSNIQIPGTGIWDRQRLHGPLSQPHGAQPSLADGGSASPLPQYPAPSSGTEIHSASTERLGSDCMEELRRHLKDTYDERAILTSEISSATQEVELTKRRYENWDDGFLMKRIRKESFAARREAADTAAAKLEELKEQLRLTTLATEISVDPEQAEPYYRMRDDFAALSECQRIWNIVTQRPIDRIAERRTAITEITNWPVSFSLASCDLIQWDQTIPHLQNHTGGDMYIYPGFILYRASKQAFALIDVRDVSLTFVSSEVTEAGTVPSDTEVIGQTWAKANKDGSQDRRFRSNYQLPVVRYGTLVFSSPDGLDVRYVCSNAALAERFATAWDAFGMSFYEQGGAVPRMTKAEALEKFKAAFERCKIASLKLIDSIQSLSKDDFMAYMATVVALIDAARGFVANSGLSPKLRSQFRGFIEKLEVSRSEFETSVSTGGMTMNTLTAYTDVLVEFFNVIRAAFFDAPPHP